MSESDANESESGHVANAQSPEPASLDLTKGGSAELSWGVGLALFLLTVIVFVPAIGAGLVYWDDHRYLMETQHLGFTREALNFAFSATYGGHYQPLTWLSYALDYSFWRDEPLGYHLTNVVLHAITVVLVYFLTRMMLRLSFRERLSQHAPGMVLAAAFAAGVFGLHPLRVESVAWLAERRDVLSGLFLVLSVMCYLRYAVSRGPEDEQPSPSASPVYWLAVICCLVSLLAKATAVMLGPLLLLLDAYPLRRLVLAGEGAGVNGEHAKAGAGIKRVSLGAALGEKAPFLVLGLIFGLMAVRAQSTANAMYPLAEYGLVDRLAQSVYGLVWYPWKMLVPLHLGPLYPIPDGDVLFGARLFISLGAAVIGLSLIVMARRWWPGLLAATLAYVVLVFPVLGLLQSGPQLVADRYSYMSCVGFAMAGGAGMLLLLRWISQRRPREAISVGALLSLGIVTLFAQMTRIQEGYWQDRMTLWTHALTIAPDSYVVNTNLALAYSAAAEDGTSSDPRATYETALGYYSRGLEIEPNDVIALHNSAVVLEKLGRIEQAKQRYIAALEREPDRVGPQTPLVKILIAEGHYRQALTVIADVWRRAQSKPELVTPELMEMGAVLIATIDDDQVRNREQAKQWIRVALDIEGNQVRPSTMLAFATVLAEFGEFEKAVETIKIAMQGAEQRGEDPAVYQHRLELFEAKQPYRIPVAGQASDTPDKASAPEGSADGGEQTISEPPQ